MKSTDCLKSHLLEVLDGTSVHCGIERAVANIPFELWGKKVKNAPHTLFDLLEHIRLSVQDIVEYIDDPNYQAANWPDGYWPKQPKPKTTDEVQQSIEELRRALKKVKKWIEKSPLLQPLPHGDPSHTLAREVMILSDHLAYHVGQTVLMRQLLKCWE